MAKLFDFITSKVKQYNTTNNSYNKTKHEEKEKARQAEVMARIAMEEELRLKHELEKSKHLEKEAENPYSGKQELYDYQNKVLRLTFDMYYYDKAECYIENLKNVIDQYDKYKDAYLFIKDDSGFYKQTFESKHGTAIKTIKEDCDKCERVISIINNCVKKDASEYEKQIEVFLTAYSRLKPMLKNGKPSLFRYSLTLDTISKLKDIPEDALTEYVLKNSVLKVKKRNKYSNLDFVLSSIEFGDLPIDYLFVSGISDDLNLSNQIKNELEMYSAYDKKLFDRTKMFENMFNSIKNTELRINNHTQNKRRNIDQMPETKIEKIGQRFNVDNYLRKFVVIGLNVNGEYADESNITEIAIIKYNELRPVETLNTLLNYDGSSEFENTSQLVFYPTLNEISRQITDFISDYPVVCFNVGNDIKYLYTNGIKMDYVDKKFYDVLSLAKKIEYPTNCENLYDYCDQYDIFYENQGDLLHDTLATGELFLNVVTAIVNGKDYVQSSVIYDPIGSNNEFSTNGKTFVSDSLFDDVLDLLSENEYISDMLLQRRLGIGSTRASKIMESLENRGLITSESNKKKSLLYDE